MYQIFLSKNQGFLFLILCLLCTTLISCVSARNNQFNQFAQAGIKYTDAANTVVNESGKASIDADSLVLLTIRDNLNEEQLKDILIEHNKALITRLELLNEITEHNTLLQNYFIELSKIADGNLSYNVADTATSTANAIVEVGNIIKSGSFGGDNIGDIVQPIATIIVAQYQNSILENELKERSQVIANELEIQRAAMKALSDSMKSDYALIIQHEEDEKVLVPFVTISRDLPSTWSKSRRGFLITSIQIESVDVAEEAAENLKDSFIALVEDRFTSEDLALLIQDINRIKSLIEALQSNDSERNNSGQNNI